jgi:hypothetical protein
MGDPKLCTVEGEWSLRNAPAEGEMRVPIADAAEPIPLFV